MPLSKNLEFSVGVCYNKRQRKKNFLICHKAFVCVMRSAKEEVANELSYYDEPPVWYWGEYYCERTFREDDVEHGMRENAFESEADAIRELAKQPCIIIGRCASEFLKDKSNVINIYVCADKEDRIKRIMKLFSLTREAAEVMLEETDKQRAEYYYKNTGKTWGDVNNYHMILNTSDLGIENCADILMRYFEMKDYI